MYIKLAWRNIWRNKRRTWITITSIVLSVMLAFLMRSMQEGTYNSMIDNVAGAYSGHIQVQHNGYWEQQSLNNTFVYSDSLKQQLDPAKYTSIKHMVPRLESFVLASSGKKTKGSRLIGIDPAKEAKLMNPEDKLVQGKYLSSGENGILLSEGLADNINSGVGDTVILLGKGYHGRQAAGKYPVKGIVKIPSPDLNKRLSFLPLAQAQSLFFTPNRLTSLAMLTEKSDHLKPTVQKLEAGLDSTLTTKTWKTTNKDLVQVIQADRGSGVLMLMILYIVIGFGILGTVIMMTMERRQEFAILLGIGMRRLKLALVALFETIMMAFTGIFLGLVGGYPVVAYFHVNPIELTGQAAEATESFGIEPVMPFALEPNVFFDQMGIVLIIALLTAIYPVINILRLNIVEGIRS